jgi:hypothetical protein
LDFNVLQPNISGISAGAVRQNQIGCNNRLMVFLSETCPLITVSWPAKGQNIKIA